MATSYDIMKMARDTTINWAANNPTLGEGEPGYDITLKRFKIGDGTTAWNSLAFQAAVGPTGATGAGYGGTSVTPLTIGTGAQSLTTQAGLAYNTGDWAMIVDSAGTSNWMIGQVTSYSGTAMVVDVTLTNGSGTISTWNISLTGARGAQGATGTSVPVVAAGGTPDVITGAYSPAITVLTDMLRVDFVASAANATATPTFQANATAAHVITKKGGTPLGVDIPGALAVCQLQYNLANTRWELLNPAVSGGSLDLVNNLKLVVNASVNKLDIFTKSGGAVPDTTNYITISIPDGTGYTQRTRKATYLSGTSQFVMADAANYWSKGSLDAEIKTAYVYAIWDTNGGIVWALGGYSGFTRCPASTTATDDDFFLLEASSTYTKVITDYCVCVGKIRYQYDTADNPDHTIQATALDAPQVIWNPKSDYSKTLNLATTVVGSGDIAEYSAISAVVKQSGTYGVCAAGMAASSISAARIMVKIKTGSATYGSAVQKAQFHGQGTGSFSVSAGGYISVCLNAGDTIHSGIEVSNATGNANLYGDNSFVGGTTLSFFRLD